MNPDLGYGSHAPVLAAAVARTTGPVLELGCGHWSTHMLRLMCRLTGRPLESYDSDKDWAKTLNVPVVEKWSKWEPILDRFGVIFIDCAPGEDRYLLAMQLKERADFIVLHDAECDTRHGGGGNYQYDAILPHFKYVEFFRALRPVTLILSDKEPFGLTKEEQTA